MSRVTLSYVLAMVIVVLILVVGVLIQNWWDSRKGRK